MIADDNEPPSPPDLRRARAELKAESREAILAAAAAVLLDEGPAALTVRRVARAVNASTKVIYTAFGGKDGLLDALYLHSFSGLERSFAVQCGIEPPAERLIALTLAYREYALTHPALYNVMFGDLGRAYETPLSSRQEAWRTFRILRDTIGLVPPLSDTENADRKTRLLWATMHGIVSLELCGLLGARDASERLFHEAVAGVYRTHIQ